MDANLLSYILSLAASMTWDGLKIVFRRKLDHSPETQAMFAVASTMESFYQYMNFEYSEELVMDGFISGVREYKDLKWRLRDVIEYAIGQPITDEQFAWWVETYRKNTSWNEKPFIDRDQTLSRLKHKFSMTNVHSVGDTGGIIGRTIDAFNFSWKQEVIELLRPLNLDLSFAMKPEKCDVILSFFRGLEIDSEQLEDENLLYEYLNHPHFNKVQLVSGTSGAGKTHFVNDYEQEALRRFGDIPIPCHVNTISLQSLRTDIMDSLYSLIEIKYDSLDDYVSLLNALSMKIAFVIENINVLLNDDWDTVVSVVEDIVKYDTFKFIITINEYEYYQLEKEPIFLERYCIENLDSSFFKYCLSIDDFNKRKDIVGAILKTEFDVESEFSAGLTTPQEAIYYGECVREEKDVSPPSSYYGYIEKITRWKEGKVNSVLLEKILMEVVEQKSSVVKTQQDVTSFRHAQLMTLEEKSSIFETAPVYHLRIYPYWAAKIVGFDNDGLLEYSDDLKEWIVSCYIFYRYQYGIGIDDLQVFFSDLREKGLLEYAVFCAHKADTGFIRGLNSFLLSIEIDNTRLCYAVLRFIGQCPLRIAEKLALCMHMAKELNEFGLIELYGRTLEYILTTASKANNLRKNMLVLAQCNVKNINHISGYKVGDRYMDLLKNSRLRELTWNIVQFIMQNDLENIIATGNNESFLDFFLRKCFEYHIIYRNESLWKIYYDLKDLFRIASPIGSFIKRNLTCAAGNLFENRYDDEYRDEYIKIAQHFAESDNLYDRLTAWFLIRNSVSEPYDELNRELFDVLKDLMLDSEIMKRVGAEIDEFIKRQVTANTASI